jgi:hypothetical protein
MGSDLRNQEVYQSLDLLNAYHGVEPWEIYCIFIFIDRRKVAGRAGHAAICEIRAMRYNLQIMNH